MDSMLTCPLCSTEYEADERAACSACPVGQGCSMVCCPSCGHTTIDPRQSRMATWLSRLLPKDDASQSIHLQFVGDEVPLSEVGAGQEARIVSLETLPLTRQRYLHAFGIVPGAIISIQQQRPVTIIEVDRTELAIEREVAEGIRTAIQLVRTK